jgi:hypothetical protein
LKLNVRSTLVVLCYSPSRLSKDFVFRNHGEVSFRLLGWYVSSTAVGSLIRLLVINAF